MIIKTAYAILLLFFYSNAVSAQKKLIIDRDTIPFSELKIIEQEGVGKYYIDGFEVDDNGIYYFLLNTRDSTYLYRYSQGKKLSEKSFDDFHAGRMYIENDSIIIFDYYYGSNSIYTSLLI